MAYPLGTSQTLPIHTPLLAVQNTPRSALRVERRKKLSRCFCLHCLLTLSLDGIIQSDNNEKIKEKCRRTERGLACVYVCVYIRTLNTCYSHTIYIICIFYNTSLSCLSLPIYNTLIPCSSRAHRKKKVETKNNSRTRLLPLTFATCFICADPLSRN